MHLWITFAISVSLCLAQPTPDLAAAVAAKHQQIQTAIASGDFKKASTLSNELSHLIAEEWARQLPTPQQMLAKAEATEAKFASDPNPNSRLYSLWLLPNFAFKAGDFTKAAYYASLTLEVASQANKEGVYGDCIFEAYTVQGQLAIRNGNLAAARQDLLNSLSAASYSKNLSHRYALRYDLAQALLDRGERDVVVQFLEKCAALIPADQSNYAVWIAAIKGGATPKLNSLDWR